LTDAVFGGPEPEGAGRRGGLFVALALLLLALIFIFWFRVGEMAGERQKIAGQKGRYIGNTCIYLSIYLSIYFL